MEKTVKREKRIGVMNVGTKKGGNTASEIKRIQSLLPYADHGAYEQLRERIRNLAETPNDAETPVSLRPLNIPVFQTGTTATNYLRLCGRSIVLAKLTIVKMNEQTAVISAKDVETGKIEEFVVPHTELGFLTERHATC